MDHARHTPEYLIATEEGIVKAYAVRRVPSDQRWDGARISQIRGSPDNWKLDASAEAEMVELDDRGRLESADLLDGRVGSRTGERRSMYLSRKDFSVHGHTDGCPGCRDIASKKRGQMAPHTVACRKRMEGAVRTSDPDRWERFLLRRRQEEAAQEEAEAPATPIVEDVPAEDADLFGGWGAPRAG